MYILSFHIRKNILNPDNENLINNHIVKYISLTHIELANYQQLSEIKKRNVLESNTIAITSQNAAIWLVNNLTSWRGVIYTNSTKTECILQQMPNVKTHVSNHSYAKNLGLLIQKSKVKSFIHLTGNLGLNDLSEMAVNNDINYQRLEVYSTQLTPKPCNLSLINVCIFTSPSQVVSFFKVNTWKKSIFALCIGKTTAKQLEQHGVPTPNIYYPQKANYLAMLELLPEIENKIEQQKTK